MTSMGEWNRAEHRKHRIQRLINYLLELLRKSGSGLSSFVATGGSNALGIAFSGHALSLASQRERGWTSVTIL